MEESDSSRLSTRDELVKGSLIDEQDRAAREAVWLPRSPIERIRLLFPRSRSTMNQELCAYLIRGDGRVSEMPTDELLVALEQVRQASTPQEQSGSSNKAVVFAFLQTLKRVMRTSRDGWQAEPFEASRHTSCESGGEVKNDARSELESVELQA